MFGVLWTNALGEEYFVDASGRPTSFVLSETHATEAEARAFADEHVGGDERYTILGID